MVKDIRTRYASISDLDSLFKIEQKAWGKQGASKGMLEERLLEPGNYTIAVLESGEIMCFTQIKSITEDQLAESSCNWYSLMRLKPNTNGRLFFGYNISGVKGRSDFNFGTKALEATYAALLDLNGKCMFAGGRMINYSIWANDIPPDIYPLLLKDGFDTYCVTKDSGIFKVGTISIVDSKFRWQKEDDYLFLEPHKARLILSKCRSLDPIINIYRTAVLLEQHADFIGVIPDYYGDEKSDNYGLLYVWCNPFTDFNKESISFLKNTFKYISVRNYF